MTDDPQIPAGKEQEPVYEDEPDRWDQEAQQDRALNGDTIFNPDAMEALARMVSDRRDADLPDLIMLESWPQVPEEILYEPVESIIGRCEGPIRNTEDTEFNTEKGGVIFRRPKSTMFVRVILADGREAMERYTPDRHGEWNDIPDTGLTPTELLEQLYGFGDEEIDQGQQFQRVRKQPGGDSRTKWPSGRFPGIKKR